MQAGKTLQLVMEVPINLLQLVAHFGPTNKYSKLKYIKKKKKHCHLQQQQLTIFHITWGWYGPCVPMFFPGRI